MSNTWNRGPDRANKLQRDKGLGRQSSGPAGDCLALSDLDHDTRTTLMAMVARGTPAEQIAERTGASLVIVRALIAATKG